MREDLTKIRDIKKDGDKFEANVVKIIEDKDLFLETTNKVAK